MDEEMFKPRFEGQAAYIVPPISNYISGPAGMVYNPGTALSPEWKNTFFISEFVGNPARSAIHSFRLRSEEHTSELQSLMRISYAVFCLKKKNNNYYINPDAYT